MEQRLQELFPDQIVQIREYQSFVNQPERIQISSQQDIQDYDPNTLTSYYNFRVRLSRPALNVKSIQLARASIPNAVTNIPDQETTLWFYALPQVSTGTIYTSVGGFPGAAVYTFDTSGNLYTAPGGVLVPSSAIYFDSGLLVIDTDIDSPFQYNTLDAVTLPLSPTPAFYGGDPLQVKYFVEYDAPELATRRLNYLRYIRLVPSYAQPELLDGFVGGFNRSFQDYDDLTTELNNATIDDPLNGEPSNDIPGTFKFIPNLVSFDYNTRFNKFVFTGLNPEFRYLPCASDDPLWLLAASELQTRDRQNTRFEFSGVTTIIQPFQPYRNLNLRLGFNYATYPDPINYTQMIRPIPPFIVSPPPNLQDPFTSYDHVAPGYCDLVYTSCCHLYTDVTGGSTLDTIAEKALLASVPLNTPSLGVGFHSLPLNNPLTKISSQLYEIYIEMRTDTGEPMYFGNNVVISLELILTY